METFQVDVPETQDSVEKLTSDSNQGAETTLRLENTLDEVTIENSMLQSQLATLEEEKKSSERFVDSSMLEKDTFENIENTNLKERSDSLERQEQNLEEEAGSHNGEYEKQIETVKVELSGAQESVEKLTAESNPEAQTVSNLENTLDEVTIESPVLQKEGATPEEAKSPERSVDYSISEKARLHQGFETISELENTLDEVTKERSVLQIHVATLEDEKKSSERSVVSSISEKDTFENIESINLGERSDSIERQKMNLEEEAGLLVAKIDEYEEQTETLKVEVSEAQESMEMLSAKSNPGAENTVDEGTIKSLKLQTQVATLEEEKKSLQGFEDNSILEEDSVENIIEDLTVQVNLQQEEYKILLAKLEDMNNSKTAEKHDLDLGISNLTAQTNKHRSRFQLLKAKLQRGKRTEAELASITKQLESAESRDQMDHISSVDRNLVTVDRNLVTDSPRPKKRNFIKLALNNKYTISTEEKLQQRKDREKNREHYKGMKQFFGVNNSNRPVH